MAISTWELQSQTSQGAITLAVSTMGSDAPSSARPIKLTKGNYSAYPFLTIQAAINALPKTIRHTTNINIGTGTFAGFSFEGFNLYSTASINGTLDTWTPTTGPSSGTATSGADGQLTLTGAGWTVDDLVGKFLTITAGTAAGTIIPILKNTTDTIYTAPYATVYDNTSQFVIQDSVTVVNTAAISSLATGCGIIVAASLATSLAYPAIQKIHVASSPSITSQGIRCLCYCRVTYCQVESGTIMGIACTSGDQSSCRIYFCYATGCSNTAFNVGGVGSGSIAGSVAKSSASGVSIYGCGSQFVLWGYAARNCNYGISLTACPELYTAYGISIFNCNRAIWSSRSSITIGTYFLFDNIAVSPFVLDRTTIVHNSGLISGSGNTGWGLNLNGVANSFQCFTATTPTITGTLGAVTVDGVNDETWACLAIVGNAVVDAATGARIVRS
jgi:hypothetical protein